MRFYLLACTVVIVSMLLSTLHFREWLSTHTVLTASSSTSWSSVSWHKISLHLIVMVCQGPLIHAQGHLELTNYTSWSDIWSYIVPLSKNSSMVLKERLRFMMQCLKTFSVFPSTFKARRPLAWFCKNLKYVCTWQFACIMHESHAAEQKHWSHSYRTISHA